jgi:hypothetical protein
MEKIIRINENQAKKLKLLLKEELSNEEYENLKNLIKAGGDNYKIAKEIANVNGIPIEKIMQEIIDDLNINVYEIVDGFFFAAIDFDEESLIDQAIEIEGEDFYASAYINIDRITKHSQEKAYNLINQILVQLTPDELEELLEQDLEDMGRGLYYRMIGSASLSDIIDISWDLEKSLNRIIDSDRIFMIDGLDFTDDWWLTF